MDSLWIESVIMALKRTPAERHLLARICYRAAGGDGHCRDSNRELGKAIGIHFQTVSDMVQRLDVAKLITAVTDPKSANVRTITPLPELLLPYKSNADRYKSKADSKTARKSSGDYQSNHDSTISQSPIPYTPNADSDYKHNADTLSVKDVDPISQSPIAYQSIADSTYKEEKTLEKEENKRQQQPDSPNSESDGGGGEEKDFDSSEQKKEGKAPPQPPPTILPPTSDEVRQNLIQSGDHRRYAVEQLKIAKSEADYADLIEIYITQQQAQADETHPAFKSVRDARRHFMNWLGKRLEFSNPNTGKSHANSAAANRKELAKPRPGTSFGQL